MTNYVLLHGGFTDGWYWSEVAERLRARGHEVTVVDQLPSAGQKDRTSLGTLDDDVAAARGAVDAFDTPVVLVAHSYGGMIAAELADHPNVAHSVYVTAMLPARGQTGMDVLATADGPMDWVVPGEDGIIRVVDDLERLRQVLCADVPAARAHEVLSRGGAQSASSMTQPSACPDRGHPVTYVIAENDAVFSPAAQEKWAAQADHVVRLAATHQVMVSVPEELTDVLHEIA
jgi:pimeloyl-ACP methyl ester carboxylesterase